MDETVVEHEEKEEKKSSYKSNLKIKEFYERAVRYGYGSKSKRWIKSYQF